MTTQTQTTEQKPADQQPVPVTQTQTGEQMKETVETKQVNTSDIFTRLSTVKIPEKQTDQPIETGKFDVRSIENIKDPQARKYAEEAYKSFERGYGQKYQSLADERRKLESERAELSKWTPERVQSLLQNPEFVNAASAIIGSNENGDGQPVTTRTNTQPVTEADKRLKELEAEMNNLKKSNMEAFNKQQDSQLSTKYPGYNPIIVDDTINKLMRGEVVATREDIWKVIRYNDDVQRAYLLGMQDAKGGIGDKVDSSTIPSSTTAVTQSDKPSAEKGETDGNFFKRLYMHNASKTSTAKK